MIGKKKSGKLKKKSKSSANVYSERDTLLTENKKPRKIEEEEDDEDQEDGGVVGGGEEEEFQDEIPSESTRLQQKRSNLNYGIGIFMSLVLGLSFFVWWTWPSAKTWGSDIPDSFDHLKEQISNVPPHVAGAICILFAVFSIMACCHAHQQDDEGNMLEMCWHGYFVVPPFVVISLAFGILWFTKSGVKDIRIVRHFISKSSTDVIPLKCGISHHNAIDASTRRTSKQGTCGGVRDGHWQGAWYSFMGSGECVKLSTCNDITTSSGIDTQIRLYCAKGGVDNEDDLFVSDATEMACLAGDEDSASDVCDYSDASHVWFKAEMDQEYFIYVDAFYQSNGEFQLDVECVQCDEVDAYGQFDHDESGACDI